MEDGIGKAYMSWRDVAEEFSCGRSKAMLIMHEIGVVYIGKTAYVRRSDLDAYIAEHGGVDIEWPKSQSRKGVRRHS